MARPSQNFTVAVYHAPAFDAVAAVGVVTAAVAVFVAVGLSLPGGLGSLAAAQLLGLGAVPVVAAVATRRPLSSLGLGRPTPLALAGAALFGATFWYANLRLWAPLLEVLDQGELPALQERLLSSEVSLQLLAIAAVPALCEELTMRGVLARSLSSLGGPLAVVISAAVFAAFHMSAIRFGPTLALGIALGAMTLRTGTIWPAVVAHLFNNAAALLVAGGAITAPAWLASHPDLGLAAAVLVAGAGIAAAARPPAS
jgi:uncharacterized protein